MSNLSSDHRALLFGLGAVLCWSTVATAFKIALSLVDTYQLLFFATLTASVILLTLVLFKFGVTTLVRNFCSHWKLTLLAGLLNPFVYYHLLFRAYDLLPAQVALSINYSWAIVLTLMAVVFLKQKIQRTRFRRSRCLLCRCGDHRNRGELHVTASREFYWGGARSVIYFCMGGLLDT